MTTIAQQAPAQVSRPEALPASLSSLLNSALTATFPDGEAQFHIRHDWQPPALAEADKTAIIRTSIEPRRHWLKAAKPLEILAVLEGLMSFYWTTDVPENTRKANAKIWISLLGSYPKWAIAKAAEAWLSQPSARKPVPGDLIALIEPMIEPYRQDLLLLTALTTGKTPGEILRQQVGGNHTPRDRR